MVVMVMLVPRMLQLVAFLARVAPLFVNGSHRNPHSPPVFCITTMLHAIAPVYANPVSVAAHARVPSLPRGGTRRFDCS